MSNTFQVRLSGYGGQGIVLAGIILGEAVAIFDGKYAVQSQSYGPEARGGASRSEIVISSDEIDILEVKEPDLLLALSQEAFCKYCVDLKKDGVVIVDPEHVKEWISERTSYQVPITQMARERVGHEIVSNMIALGVIAGLTDLVSLASLKESCQRRVPPETAKTNVKALEIGYKAGLDL